MSCNDWGEGTQIDPSRDFGDRDLKFILETRREILCSQFMATAQDLRLPEQLLKVRRASSEREEACNQAAQAISEDRFDDAKCIIHDLLNP